MPQFIFDNFDKISLFAFCLMSYYTVIGYFLCKIIQQIFQK